MPQVGIRREPPKKPHKKWTPEVLEEIIAAVEDGCWQRTSALAAGVPGTIWDEWARWGKAGYEPYASFLVDLEIAEGRGILWWVRVIKKHASGESVYVLKDNDGNETGVKNIGDWRPATWFLSRKDPKRFSEKETLRQAAQEALEQEQIELSIPVLENYLGKLGWGLVPLNDQSAAGHTAKETPDAKRTTEKKPRRDPAKR